MGTHKFYIEIEKRKKGCFNGDRVFVGGRDSSFQEDVEEERFCGKEVRTPARLI